MFCDQCGTENRDGAKFCKGCGAALGVNDACSSCGAALEPGAVFCDECGTPTTAAGAEAGARASAPPSMAPVAERRHVSVLFVDLVGFTTYSEGRDPEDVRGMLSLYFERAEEIIGLYGGMVEKFIGDAVMAVWGTPVAREDDAERATRAALELVGAVAALGKSAGADLRARAGVFSGEAAVNLSAKGQGMVAGDTVNTASRLQSAAAPGTVLVDRTTYLSSRGGVAFEAIGEIDLKGKGAAIEAWRPTRIIGTMGGFRPADSLEPAFTGRDEEFRLIKDLLHATGRERKPRLASVVGIGGIGKSRLVWELAKYIDGLSDLIFWHQGRSPSYGEGVAFWALAEMVRMRAGIAETDDDETALAKLDECVGEYFPDEEDAVWVKPALKQLVGLGDTAPSGTEKLFAAWRTLFERIGEVGTVVMIFEDLHWADPGLIDFIEHVMAWARNTPILIVTLARPELLDKRPTWGAGQRNFVSVHLEPLDRDDMQLLLKSITGDLPETVRDEIVERAEGVPLYAVEMVRMLIDRGSLLQEAEGHRWVGGTDHVDVPDSLHSLIASRLDALDEDDRLLVQDASVLGKTFTVAALADVTARSRDELELRLSDLARREIMLVDTDPRSPERGQYGFVQSLIREIAYQTLSNQSRRDRHIAAARHFEATGEADVIDVIATHYVEAFNNSKKEDPAAADLAERARAALRSAATRAASLGSNRQALSLLEKAIAIAPESPGQGNLLYEAGRAASSSGRTDAAIQHLLDAIDLLQAAGEPEDVARAQHDLGVTYFLASRLEEAETMLEGAVAELDDPDGPIGARLFTELARVHLFRGNQQKSAAYSERAMSGAERAEDVGLIANGLITRGVAALISGRTTEAGVLLSGALELGEDHGLVDVQIRAYVNITANQGQIDPNLALATGEQGLQVAAMVGSADAQARMITNIVENALHMGRWDWARSLVAESAESLGDYEFQLCPPLSMLEAYAGNIDEAKRLGARYEAVADPSSVQDTGMRLCVDVTIALVEGRLRYVLGAGANMGMDTLAFLEPFGVMGRAAVWDQDLEEAKKQLELVDASSVRNSWYRARRETLEAGIAALGGDRERATQMFTDALGHWDELQIPLGKAMCQMDFALTVPGPESEGAAAEAKAFFEEAGNEYFVRRLAEAAG